MALKAIIGIFPRTARAALIVFLVVSSAAAFQSRNPPPTASFEQAIDGMPVIQRYTFGTGDDRSIGDLQRLAAQFNPYGVSGTTVINKEWQIYQQFNSDNFRFTANSLDLTATIPSDGGLFPGGIRSAQIWSKQTYQPGVSGHVVYAFEVRMKIPAGQGMWPAAWFYTQKPGKDDASEIDNPEFFNMRWQDRFDWTGFQHGPGQGAEIYSIKTNKWVWHPGFDFAADYHNYQTLWTPDAVYKYVDGKLIYAQAFKWTAEGAAQIGVNLAVGTSKTKELPGLQPESLNEFPSFLSVDHITVWAK